jgi:hypothetical protein
LCCWICVHLRHLLLVSLCFLLSPPFFCHPYYVLPPNLVCFDKVVIKKKEARCRIKKNKKTKKREGVQSVWCAPYLYPAFLASIWCPPYFVIQHFWQAAPYLVRPYLSPAFLESTHPPILCAK